LNSCGVSSTSSIKAPVLSQYNSENISWKSVTNADYYRVYDNDDNSEIASVYDTKYHFENFVDDFDCYVVSVDSNKNESSHSNVAHISRLSLSTPKITLTGTTLSWGAVTGADVYEVYGENDTVLTTTTELSYNVAGQSKAITVCVRACYSDTRLSSKNSDYSNSLIVLPDSPIKDGDELTSMNILSYQNSLTLKGTCTTGFSVKVAARTTKLVITLDNFTGTSSSSAPAFDLSSVNEGMVEMRIKGTNVIKGKDGNTSKKAMIYGSYLTMIGEANSSLSLIGANGKDGTTPTTPGEDGEDGGPGQTCVALRLTLQNMKLSLKGGNGGNGAKGADGEEGIDGRVADNTGTLTNYGGEGGNAGAGGDGGRFGYGYNTNTPTLDASSTLTSINGTTSGNGGNGGIGGDGGKGGCYYYNTGTVTNFTGGKGGHGGKGGDGTIPGKGGAGGKVGATGDYSPIRGSVVTTATLAANIHIDGVDGSDGVAY
jgi:hypothetical protein